MEKAAIQVERMRDKPQTTRETTDGVTSKGVLSVLCNGWQDV